MHTAHVTRSTTLEGMNGAGNPISKAGREKCPCFLWLVGLRSPSRRVLLSEGRIT